MPLSIGQSEAFWYPVQVEILDDGGQPQKHEFEARFRRLTMDGITAIGAATKDLDLMRQHLLGWRGVEDEAGSALPFSAENLERLLSVWPVLPALTRAFMEAHTPEGRRKN